MSDNVINMRTVDSNHPVLLQYKLTIQNLQNQIRDLESQLAKLQNP